MIIQIKKVLGYGIGPVLFVVLLIFFNNCRNQYENNYDNDQYRGRDRYDDRYSRDSNRRRNNSDLREVNTLSSVRFEPISKRQFDGDDCEDFDECQDLCEDMFSGSIRDQCENLPEDMVEVLHDAYENLKYASPSNLEDMDPSALAVLLDMDDRMIDLLKEDWGIRGVSALIDYTARSPLAVEAFQYGNNEEVFKEILLEFSELKYDESNLTSALSSNVVRHRETVLALITNADNKEAMQFVFDLLSEECSSTACKQKVICVRENITRRSSRRRNSDVCPYLGPRDRSDYCYIQGPDVWSYIENLIYDGYLNDRDLRNLDLSEQMCNSFCSQNNCYL